MSNVYGYAGAGGQAPNPTGKVNFGWIGEAFNQFGANAGIWILAALLAAIVPIIIVIVMYTMIGVSAIAAFGTGLTGHGSAASGLASGGLAAGSVILIILLFGFLLLYQPFMYGSLFRMGLKQARGEVLTATDIFSGGPVMFRMLGLSLLTGICLFIINVVLEFLLGLLHIIPAAMLAGGSSLSSSASTFGVGMLFYLLVLAVVYSTVYAFVFPAYSLVADGEGVFTALGRSVSGVSQDWARAVAFTFVFGLLYVLSAIPCGLGLFVTVPMLFIISSLVYRDMIGMPGGMGAAQPAYGAAQPGVWPPAPGATPPPPSTPPPGNWPPPAS